MPWDVSTARLPSSLSGAPGDHVRVRVIQQHASFVRAEILEVVRPGPARRDPRLSVVWSLRGVPVAARTLPAAGRKPNGRSWLTRCDSRPMPGDSAQAPSESRYRRRARLRWHVDRAGVRLGFLQAASKETVDVDSCPMLVDQLDRALVRHASLAWRRLQGRARDGSAVVWLDRARCMRA